MDNLFAFAGTLAMPGIMTAVSVYVVLCFLDIRKVVGYHIWVDVLFSVMLVFAYSGTFTGTATAFMGGLFFSFLLYFTRKWLGYAKWTRHGWRYFAGWY